MALSVKQPGAYITQHVFDLAPDVDLNRFRSAWEQTISKNAILRTVIVQSPAWGSIQVVLAGREVARWNTPSHLDGYLKKDLRTKMGYGETLYRYALTTEAASGRYSFIWTVHHAVYDGWSLQSVFRQVNLAYETRPLPNSPDFKIFVKYASLADQAAAREFWLRYLADASPAHFPPSPSTGSPSTHVTARENFSLSRIAGSDFTFSTIIRAAWAILIARYSGSDDVVFGSTVTGRSGQLRGIEDILGPTIATVPVRVRIDQGAEVLSFLNEVQSQSIAITPFEQLGLQNISRLAPAMRDICAVQNLLVIHPSDGPNDGTLGVLGTLRDEEYSNRYLTHPLVVECSIGTSDIHIKATSNTPVFDTLQAQRLVQQLKHLIVQLDEQAGKFRTLGDLDLICPEDRLQISQWNGSLPQANLFCIHDLIKIRVSQHPDTTAVCAWDGMLTYLELDILTSKLSQHLVMLGVKPEQRVPCCFEKSMWAIVAQLAILKSHAACVPLDPAHPSSRRKIIIDEVAADIVLTSPLMKDDFQGIVKTVVTIDPDMFSRLSPLSSSSKTQISPHSLAFVMFTSGSTGKPKGIMIEHVTLSSSARDHGVAMRMTSRSRVLQFSSYAFDVALFDIYTTLIFGGCVCVPSDAGRMNAIVSVISDMNVNWALLTPSFARLFSPSDVPGLRTLVLGGEAVSQDLVNVWQGRVTLINAYGPPESSACVVGEILQGVTRPGTIGRPVGGASYITDPFDHDRLVPIGNVGELLIEGPVLARGYLNDEAKTLSSFIYDPKWAGNNPDSGRRFYKTGDLVQYNSDGTIKYIGRKDTQVKVRGQHVELDEVEFHLRKLLPAGADTIVDVIKPAGAGTPILAAFICLKDRNGASSRGSNHLQANDSFRSLIAVIERSLQRVLPPYMIPSAYVPLKRVPLTISGKTNRSEVRELGEHMTAEELATCCRVEAPKRAPSTPVEEVLVKLWATVLLMESQRIGDG